MDIKHIDSMFKGWFVSNFQNAAVTTNKVEVAYKTYFAGQSIKKHFHKFSKEITLVVSGSVRINEVDYMAGTIIVVHENEAADFAAITNCSTVVVRISVSDESLLNDKYFV